MSDVRLENLTKRFGATAVVRGLDLAVASGECVVVVGPSGCGKSTLLRLIAGLETVTEGTIHIAGQDVTRLPPAQRGVSMVFQSYALYPHMTAYRNIAFGLRLAGTARNTVDQRVRQVAEMLQITDLLQRRPRELSGGQRQRVAIARAIVRDPKLLLLDEPLSNLDAALRSQTRVELAGLRDKLSATMIHVTHDQQEAMTLADRIVLLNQGRIEQVGSPVALYQRPATRFAAAFLGAPSMNFLAATAEPGLVRLVTGEQLAIPGIAAGGAVELGIRAEDLTLCGPDDTDGLTARVGLVEELGDSRIVHATRPDGAVLAVRHPVATAAPRRGEAVRVRITPDRVHLFGTDGVRLTAAR